MGLQSRRDCHQQPPSHQRQGSSCSNQDFDLDLDLSWPFGKLNGVDKDDIRETSYEVFFTSCRSSPGFGGRTALAFYSHNNDHHGDTCHGNNSGPGSAARANGVGMVTNSRIKRALGLRTLKRMPSRRSSLGGAVMTTGPSSPHAYGHSHNSSIPGISFTVPSRTSRRPLTSAEIMRLQMRVTEQGDNRLRKTLMRTLVGQVCILLLHNIIFIHIHRF